MSSARCRRDSGCCKREHRARAAIIQDGCTGVERGASRAHVVDQDDVSSSERCGVLCGGKRAPDVSVALRGGQFRLHRRSSRASECRDDGQSDVSRQVLGLVEAALSPPGRVKWHWNRDVAGGEDLHAARAHHLRERTCQRAPAVVLEGMDDGTKRAVVGTNRPGAMDSMRKPSTAGANEILRRGVTPGGQRVSAAVA